MRGRCVWLREISPGEREMATSGGEREERQAWTHDSTCIAFVYKGFPFVVRRCRNGVSRGG